MSQKPINSTAPTCIEICSGAGGQALGLEMAGFEALGQKGVRNGTKLSPKAQRGRNTTAHGNALGTSYLQQ